MARLIDEHRDALDRRLIQMRAMDEWHLLQNFLLGLLLHDIYTDVRLSAVRHDFGRDAVAITPDGQKCFVAVSFDGSYSKIHDDATRWTEDPNREPAAVMLFMTAEAPQNTTVSKWVAKIRKEFGLELRLYNRETILAHATRLGVWRETCARLGIPGYRQGYAKIAPYDGVLVRRALKARPPEWLSERIPLEQWADLTGPIRSRLILGKLGSGKTTTIFEYLERTQPYTVLVVESDLNQPSQIEGLLDEAANGAVIVIDDLHEDPKRFVSICTALRTRQTDAPDIAAKYKNVVLLAASRIQEWQAVLPEIPVTVLQDLDLLGDAELTLTNLNLDQCRRLIEICRDQWGLIIDPRLLDQAASAAAQRDATPLYVISMLAPARNRKDLTLKDEHLAGLPQNVRDLWKRYWQSLDATSQGALRLIRLFWAADTPPQPHLLAEAAKAFRISPHDLSKSLDSLERSLWLTRSAGVPSCLDVQFEVVDLDASWFQLWDTFVFAFDPSSETRIQLHNGTAKFYCEQVAPRLHVQSDLQQRLTAALRHCQALVKFGHDHQNKPSIAMASNNLSIVLNRLANLETSLEGRHSRLTQAVSAVEEAVAIYRELGLRANLAGSLNNVSNRYKDLANLETTPEGRRSRLTQAVTAVEESITIRRNLGHRADLASSLNNASNRYSDLANLETTPEGRRSRLAQAVAAVEESVVIYCKLGLRAELAGSLNNSSNICRNLAVLEITPQLCRSRLIQAVSAIKKSAAIYSELSLRADLSISLNTASIIYCDLADLETTPERRRSRLAQAVTAVEKSVSIRRELGLCQNLAVSLGTLCRSRRSQAEAADDPAEALHLRRLSRQAIDEAVSLFRDAGHMPFLLLAIQDAVTARQLIPDEIDPAELLKLIDEGLSLATSMQDDQAVDFFADLKRILSHPDT